MNNRIESLDSVRGLASFAVVIHHAFLAIPALMIANDHGYIENAAAKLLTNTPLHMFWGGHEAVMLFFILSGFVLALPFLNERNSPYPQYAIKRICRIYLPYIISMGISISLFTIINTTGINSLSDFFNYQWSHAVTPFSIISYIFMLDYDNFNINGVTWSLIHEMRISLIFPFLMVVIMKFTWKKTLFLSVTSSIFIWAAILNLNNALNISSINFFLESIAETFYYTALFVIGALFAKHRAIVINKVRSLKKITKTLLFICFIYLYNFEWLSFGFGSLKFSDSFTISSVATVIVDYSIVVSVLILFSLILSSERFQITLSKKPLLFLGKISYSLYLIHSIVILAMIHILHQYLPMPIILLLIPIVSLLAAIPYYHFVENPSAKLGKWLSTSAKSRRANELNKVDL